MRNPCENINPLLTAFATIRSKALMHMRMELNYIYDVFYQFRYEPSLKRGFFTITLTSLTGLETKERVSELRSMMTKIEQGVFSALEVRKTGSNHFTAASISSLKSEVLSTYRARNNMARNLARIVDSLANLTMQIWELDSLLVANELLSRKQLPHVLINHTMLWNSVIYLQFRLNELHTDLKLVHYDNAYYYKHPEFHVFRYKPQLIIRWNVTLILRHLANQFTIWQLHKISFFVRCSSSAGQEMLAGQRPTFYHCVTPPITK